MRQFTHVCYFDPETTAKIRAIQKNLFDLTGSRTSFEVWRPHLTVGAEIYIEDDKLQQYYLDLQKIADQFGKMKVQLGGYSFRDNWTGLKPPGFNHFAVFLDVAKNEELELLAAKIKPIVSPFPKYFDIGNPYKPRVTLAFRDLSEVGLLKAKNFLADKPLAREGLFDGFSIAEGSYQSKYSEVKRFKFHS